MDGNLASAYPIPYRRNTCLRFFRVFSLFLRFFCRFFPEEQKKEGHRFFARYNLKKCQAEVHLARYNFRKCQSEVHLARYNFNVAQRYTLLGIICENANFRGTP